MRLYLSSCLIVILLISGCRDEEVNTPPTADLDVFPGMADTSSYIRFDASGSSDAETNLELLQFRWDIDGDGKWDTDFIRDPLFIWQYATTGYYSAICEVRDEGGLTAQDTVKVMIKINFIRSTFVDTRDGCNYKMVLIDKTWWMAENLKYGTLIDPSVTPTDNQITERYMRDSSDDQRDFYGGYYTWNEMTDYQRDTVNGICPPGWRLITLADYHSIDRFWNSVDPVFYLKPGGYTGLDIAVDGGLFSLIEKSFYNPLQVGLLWVKDRVNIDGKFKKRTMEFGPNYYSLYGAEEWNAASLPQYWKMSWGKEMDFNMIALNVRCVKNDN